MAGVDSSLIQIRNTVTEFKTWGFCPQPFYCLGKCSSAPVFLLFSVQLPVYIIYAWFNHLL